MAGAQRAMLDHGLGVRGQVSDQHHLARGQQNREQSQANAVRAIHVPILVHYRTCGGVNSL